MEQQEQVKISQIGNWGRNGKTFGSFSAIFITRL